MTDKNDTFHADYDHKMISVYDAEVRKLEVENERLRADNAELSAECDQWQKKLTDDAWPEIKRLRAHVALREKMIEILQKHHRHLADDAICQVCGV